MNLCTACVQRGTIKVVPRLDLAAIANRKPEDARSNFGKQPKVKPPARPFNPDEVRVWGGRVDSQQECAAGRHEFLCVVFSCVGKFIARNIGAELHGLIDQ
jgi:hypothetical protein